MARAEAFSGAAANVMLVGTRLDLNDALRQGLSVWLLQNRQEHLVAHETGQRTPVDVEEACGRTRWTFAKDLPPERVVLGIGGHVIRDDIEHDAHAVDPQVSASRRQAA